MREEDSKLPKVNWVREKERGEREERERNKERKTKREKDKDRLTNLELNYYYVCSQSQIFFFSKSNTLPIQLIDLCFP